MFFSIDIFLFWNLIYKWLFDGANITQKVVETNQPPSISYNIAVFCASIRILDLSNVLNLKVFQMQSFKSILE